MAELIAIIGRLSSERSRLDRLIGGLKAQLAALQALEPPPRRGRKSMGDAERAEVSRRLKRYWATDGSHRRKKP